MWVQEMGWGHPWSTRGLEHCTPILRDFAQVASRENSRVLRKGWRVEEVIDDELTPDSRADSFNSEEGFGSPVRNRCECLGATSLHRLRTI